MRKILFPFLVLTITLNSCSKSDDETIASKNAISPPPWIIGTWMTGENAGFTFEKDDLKLITLGGSQSMKGVMQLQQDSGVENSVVEIETDEMYHVTLNFAAGQSSIYEFTKKSDEVIIWSNTSFKTEYTKQ
jgi:hypothetical protein